MPREFQDFSQEVSQGTDKIKNSLDAVRDAADQADVSSGKLSDTQNASIRVADSYARSMAGVSKELTGVAGSAQTISRGVSAADASIRSFGSSLSSIRTDAGDAVSGLSEVRDVSMEVASAMETISGRKVGIEFDASSAMKARDALYSIEEQLDTLDGSEVAATVSLSKAEEAEKQAGGIAEQVGNLQEQLKKLQDQADEDLGLRKTLGQLEKSIKSTQAELLDMEGTVGRIDRQRYIDLSVRLAGLREFVEFSDRYTETEKAELELAAASGKLGDALDDLASKNELLAARQRKATREAVEAAQATRAYAGEVDKASSLTDLAANKFAEGEKEARDFAGGLGVTNGVLIGAGVAAVYLAGKAAELIDQFKDARLELGTFNVELAALERRARGLGFAGTFDSLRDDLGLTRAQSKEFFDVFREGAQSGVIAADKLAVAAVQLRNTFGGDQTARLREYVELLEMIPSIDTDLAITASFDDRAASVFALARAGKIETVIDLQAAGLVGGLEAEVLAPDDVELINAAQKTEKTVEDVSDFLTGTLFPSWGPQFSAIAAGTTKIIAGLGAAVATLGTLSFLSGKQIIAQHGTTAAVLKTGAADAVGDLTDLAKKGGFFASVKALFVSGGAAGAGGAAAGGTAAAGGAAAGGGVAAGAGATALGAVALPVAIAAAVLALGAATAYAGEKLTDYGDDLIDEGKKVSGGLAKLNGASMKAQAALLLLGPIGGTFASVWFAGEDAGKGLEALGQGLQEQAGNYYKYNENIVAAGMVMEDFGKTVKEGVKDFKNSVMELAKDIPGIVEQLAELSPVIGPVVDAFRRLPELVYSEEYRKAIGDLADETDMLNARLRSVRLTSERYNTALVKDQKRVQISALALQRQLKATEAAVNSGKVAFLDFRNEVQGLRLDNLAELGGTADQFNNAIRQASDGVSRRFESLADSLGRRRAEILRDAKLSAADRRNALLDLKKQELEATRVFVEGVERVVGALFKAPQIIQANLEREFARAKFDLRVEEGVGGFDELLQNIEGRFEQFDKELSGTLDAWSQTQAELRSAQEKLDQVQKDALEKLREGFEDLPDEAQKAIGKLKFEKGQLKNLGDAQKALKTVREETDRTIDDINKLTEGLPEESFVRLAAGLKRTTADAKGFGAAAKEAQEDLAELREDLADDKSPKAAQKVKEAEENVAEIRSRALKATEESNKIQEKLKSTLGRQLKGQFTQAEIETAIAQITDKVVNSTDITADELLKQDDNSKVVEAILKKIRKTESNAAKEVGKRLPSLLKQADAQVKAEAVLSAVVEGQSVANKKLELRNKAFENVKQLVEESEKLAEDLVKAAEAGVRTQQRELDIVKSRQSLALLTNSTTENLLREREKENQIASMSIEQVDRAIAIAEKRRALLEQRIAVEQDPGKLTALRRAAKELESTIVTLNQKRGEAVEALGRTGDVITGALDRFNDSVSGRRIQQQFDLSDVTAEVAAFSSDFASVIAESTDIAIAAARERAVQERKLLANTLAQEKRQIEGRADAIEKTQGVAARRRFLDEQKILLEAKKRTREAEIEVAQKRRVVEAAAREASLKMESIDVDASVIDAQMDFLSEVGGSFSQINRLQQASVALERQRLAVLEEEAAVARGQLGDSLETRKKEAAVEIQRLKLRKAEFGIQKDIFEKLIGKAFGELRSDIGAARRRASDVALLGREGTRVALRSGLLAGAGGGRVRTIDERAAQRALGGLAGLGGELKKAEALGGAGPERLSIEEEMARSGKTTAESTKELADAGTTRGSLFTHDFNVVSILREIALRMGIMIGATEDVEGAVKDAGKKTEAGMAADRVSDAKDDRRAMTVMEQLAVAKKGFREQLTMARMLSQREDSSEEAAEATEAARAELVRIRRLESEVRRREIMSPIAGGTTPTTEMRRILSGKPSPEEKVFQQHQLESATKAAKASETTATEAKKTTAQVKRQERPGSAVAEETADEMAKANEKLDRIGEEEVRTRAQDEANVKDVTKTTKAEVEAAEGPEANKAAVKEVTDRMGPEQRQRAQRSTMEDISGLGMGALETGGAMLRRTADRSEALAVRVMGQINVVMNTKLFRAEMANLVAEVINTEQVRSALDKRYLTEAK